MWFRWIILKKFCSIFFKSYKMCVDTFTKIIHFDLQSHLNATHRIPTRNVHPLAGWRSNLWFPHEIPGKKLRPPISNTFGATIVETLATTQLPINFLFHLFQSLPNIKIDWYKLAHDIYIEKNSKHSRFISNTRLFRVMHRLESIQFPKDLQFFFIHFTNRTCFSFYKSDF